VARYGNRAGNIEPIRLAASDKEFFNTDEADLLTKPGTAKTLSTWHAARAECCRSHRIDYVSSTLTPDSRYTARSPTPRPTQSVAPT